MDWHAKRRLVGERTMRACSNAGSDVCITSHVPVYYAPCMRFMAQANCEKVRLGMRDEYSAVCGSLEEPSRVQGGLVQTQQGEEDHEGKAMVRAE